MDYMDVLDIMEAVVVGSPRHPKPELIQTDECSGDLYTLKVAVNFHGLEYFIFLDLLDDGRRFFRNPFGEDSIDKEDNTPLFNKILFTLRFKGGSEHQSAMYTPIVFDKIADKAFNYFMNDYAKQGRTLSLSTYISYFGIDDNDADSIAELLARDESEKKDLIACIKKLSPHSLFNEPIERNLGAWQVNEEGKLSVDEFRKGLLIDYQRNTGDLFG